VVPETEVTGSSATGALPSWRDGAAKQAIHDFVGRTCGDGLGAVPDEERVAVFDNDGTLWCEKPMPIQLDFILRRLFEMAEAKPELRDRQSWKAAHERDYDWLGALMAEHYAGDDSNVKILAAGILAAYEGISVENFEAQSDEFLHSAQHPTLGRGYLQCSYKPMVELLAYLEANGFANYIASGGGRDFMAPDQHGGVRRSARAGHRERLRACLRRRRAGRHDHAQGRGRLFGRRPGEADPHLEPHRASTPDRCGELER